VLEAERRAIEERGRSRLFVLKGRQGGITTLQQARNLHYIWANPGTYVVTLAQSRDQTDKIFRITRRATDNFPHGLMPKMGTAKTREISFPSLDSAFWTGTAGGSRIGAGLTLSRVHGSEACFWDDFLNTLNAIEPAMRPTDSSIVLESTASSHGDEAYGFYADAKNGVNGYDAIFIPWWECDIDNYRSPLLDPDEIGQLEPDESFLVEQYGLDLEQIKWRRETMRRMGASLFLQEYAENEETCWLTSGDLFYDSGVLKKLLDSSSQPVSVEGVSAEHYVGEVEVFAHYDGSERIIIGADTAEGGGKDRSTFVVRGYPSGKLYEQFSDSKIEPKDFAAIVNQRGRKYGRAFLVIEKNGHGITVLRELRDTWKYPSSRIYHRQVYDQVMKRQTLKIGWATTGDTKVQMLDAGRDIIWAAADGTLMAPSTETLRDAFSVVRDERGDVSLNGRDMLVAETLAWLGRAHVGGSYKGFTIPM